MGPDEKRSYGILREMSQENVEVVRRLMDAFNQRDLPGFLACTDATVRLFAPQTASSVGRKTMYSGHDEVREYFRDVATTWDDLQLTPLEFHTTGDHVVAIGKVTGKRGVETLDAPAGWAWKLRDGKVILGRAYERPEEALRDAGIR